MEIREESVWHRNKSSIFENLRSIALTDGAGTQENISERILDVEKIIIILVLEIQEFILIFIISNICVNYKKKKKKTPILGDSHLPPTHDVGIKNKN